MAFVGVKYSPRPNKSTPVFTNPFGPASALFTNVPSRSSRASSTSSFASFDSIATQQSRPNSIAEILALSRSSDRNASLTALGNSQRRPSCFSILEVEEERAEFGEKALSVLEPRNSIGYWGVKEVLETSEGSRRSSC